MWPRVVLPLDKLSWNIKLRLATGRIPCSQHGANPARIPVDIQDLTDADIPVLSEAKYPNALLLDGSRIMIEDLTVQKNGLQAILGADPDWPMSFLKLYEPDDDILTTVFTEAGTSFVLRITKTGFDPRDVIWYEWDNGRLTVGSDVLFGRDVRIENASLGAIYTRDWETRLMDFSTVVHIEHAGNITFAAGYVLDLMTNGSSFKPRRISQSAQPTPESGELLLWRDTDDDKTYIVYTDPDVGVRKIEMT